MPNPSPRKLKTCIACIHFKQLNLEMGLCEQPYNLDHYKHFLALDHGGCGSWEDELNQRKEIVVDRLSDED